MSSLDLINFRKLLEARRQEIIAEHAKVSEPFRQRVAEVEHAITLLDDMQNLPSLDGTFVPQSPEPGAEK